MDGVKIIAVLLLSFFFTGCGNVMNDLNPSNADKRPAVKAGTIGPYVNQLAPDFTLSDTLGNSVALSSLLTSTTTRGVVLYCTMWCSICDDEMTTIQTSMMPNFPDVTFIALDYVSATVSEARSSEVANGFSGSGFIVLADTSQAVLNLYNGTMGTTVVIDKNGVVRMNETYKGAKLQSILGGLP